MKKFIIIIIILLMKYPHQSFTIKASESLNNDTNLETIITAFCLNTLRSEMKDSNLVPPDGMEDFTCNCFFKALVDGDSIEKSQSKCIEIALKKYDLEKEIKR